ncbi:MAG: flavodoxin family protein [Pseudodesulfovibrio sp.]
MKLLCLAGSLRNTLRGNDVRDMVDVLKKVENQEQLSMLLSARGQSGPDQDDLDIKKKYSNSEMMMCFAAWAALQKGIDVEMHSLADYFGDRPLTDFSQTTLLERIAQADGILLSGPVYFGDRSSLAHDLIRLIRNNEGLVKGKIFAGLSVGAKRNGGQETCLIYQMQDFLQQGCIAVGNDAGTTSQYGGTGHAGEMGTAAADAYGVKTTIGTGNRIAEVIKLMNMAKSYKLKDKPKVGIFVLQDKGNLCSDFVQKTIIDTPLSDKANFKLFSLADETVRRCLGCTVCPRDIGPDKEYRCTVRDKNDIFARIHEDLIDIDAMLFGGYSPVHFDGLSSIYQSFIERTRYIRRSDYLFSNRLVAPFLLQDVGSAEHLSIRVITSTIRHNTIMHQPIVFHRDNNEILGLEKSLGSVENFVDTAAKTTTGKLLFSADIENQTQYQPFGYTLSSLRDAKPETIEKRQQLIQDRHEKVKQAVASRLEKISSN